MNNKTIFFWLATLILCSSVSVAQERSFENILKMRLQNSGTLLENEEVRGYYLFYTLGKAKKGMRNYLLRILDENLNDIGTKTIEESKNVVLADGSFNGNLIMMKFYDYKNKMEIFMTFDKSAELVSRKERSLKKDKYAAALYGQNAKYARKNYSLHDIGGKGFLNYSTANKYKGYRIDFYPDDKSKKSWTLESSSNEKGVFSAGYACHSDDILYNFVSKRKTLKSNKYNFLMQGVDINTGKKLFEKEVIDEFAHQPLTAYYDKKNNATYVMGLYYLAKSKVNKDNGLGLFRYKVDSKGAVSDKTYLNWSKDLSKFTEVSRKGKVGGGYLYFHDIIQNPDGTIIAVAEQYKKAADAAGIAANIIAVAASTQGAGAVGGTGYTKAVIDDMAIFHFNPDFSIKSLNFIEKTKTNISLEGGYDFSNIHQLSQALKYYGYFDYLFTQKNKQEEAVSIAFLDYQKPEGGGLKKWMFGTTTYHEGKFTDDKIEIGRTKQLRQIKILRAKPGYLTIINYDKKAKTVNVHMERINY